MSSSFLYFIVSVFVFLVGTAFGSFLNCMSWRVVHGESFVSGRSHCDSCGHELGAGDLIPVISYVANKGCCRWCGAKLSKVHVIGEIISGLVFLSLFLKYGISLQGLEYLLFACILLACSFADLEGYIIPDVFLIIASVIRLVFILVSDSVLDELLFSLIGAVAVGGGLLLVVLVFEKITGKEAMGGGDLKLFAVTGLYLGWQKNILCIFLSAVIGILFAVITSKAHNEQDGSTRIPFGPSIAASAWLVMLFGDTIINSYISLFF